MLKIYYFIFAAIFFMVGRLYFFVSPVSALEANPNCSYIYGSSCPNSFLIIDKKIQHPQSGQLLDTLNSSTVTFLPGQEVSFKVEIKNDSNNDLLNIQAFEQLPEYIDFVSGPGSFDPRTKKINWTIEKLAPLELKPYFIKVKVKSADQIPASKITCLNNFAQVRKDNLIAGDNAGFCIQSKVLGSIKVLPRTGISLFDTLLGMTIVSGVLTILLLKRTRKI